jgi:hypothetical protein
MRIAAQSPNITPGGLGVTKATLSTALVDSGPGASPALAAVLLHRLAGFWLVALTGWLVLLWLRSSARGPAPDTNRPSASLRTRKPPLALTSKPILTQPDWGLTSSCCCTATRLARRLVPGRRPAAGPAPRGRTRPAGIWLQSAVDSPASWPSPACSSSTAQVTICPGEPRMPSPTRWRRSWPRRKSQPAAHRRARSPQQQPGYRRPIGPPA